MTTSESYEDYMRREGLGRFSDDTAPYGRHIAEDGWTVGKVLLIALAIILPPVAVLIRHGFRADFWINLLLTLFFFLPGQIHAIWSVLKPKRY